MSFSIDFGDDRFPLRCGTHDMNSRQYFDD